MYCFYKVLAFGCAPILYVQRVTEQQLGHLHWETPIANKMKTPSEVNLLYQLATFVANGILPFPCCLGVSVIPVTDFCHQLRLKALLCVLEVRVPLLKIVVARYKSINSVFEGLSCLVGHSEQHLPFIGARIACWG